MGRVGANNCILLECHFQILVIPSRFSRMDKKNMSFLASMHRPCYCKGYVLNRSLWMVHNRDPINDCKHKCNGSCFSHGQPILHQAYMFVCGVGVGTGGVEKVYVGGVMLGVGVEVKRKVVFVMLMLVGRRNQ